MSNFHSKWKLFLQEAEQDAKVLRKINVDRIKKEMPQSPGEEVRDYFTRIQDLERNPEYLNPIFPTGLVTWMESLPDNHFPRDGRKRFAKWLGNAIYTHETETMNNLSSVDNPEQLQIHNNDIRYVADYLNGANEFPDDLWSKSLNGMYDLAVQWHDDLKFKEDPTGDYENKEVVHKFDNGFTIVDVNTENDLDVEGEKMGHCVGGYCDDVADGRVTIYSLRDRKNNPHATIEVNSGGGVEQIKGKGNHKPKDKYAKMILQWLRTTDLDYSSSPDYLNLLTAEELQQLMIAASTGDESAMKALPPRKIPEIARSTQSPELIDFFVSQVGAVSSYGGSDTEHVITVTPELVRALANNKTLSEDQVYALAKFNLNLHRPALGRQLSVMLGADHSGRQRTEMLRPDAISIGNRIWTELGDELKSGRLSVANSDDEKLYYMEALMAIEGLSADIKREIVEYLLSESFMQAAFEVPGNSKTQIAAVYGSILQMYIRSPQSDADLVNKLYSLQKDKRFTTIIQQKDRLNSTIVSSPSMNDDLVDEIIRDIKEESPVAIRQNDWMEIVTAPNVSDSKKIEMLNIGKADTQYFSRNLSGIGLPTRGNADQLEPMLKWSFSDRSLSRQFVAAATEGKFSSKVVKYMIDSGMFDPHLVNLWADKRSMMTGKRPALESIPYESKEGVEIMKAARMMALTNYKGGVYDAGAKEDRPPWVRESSEKLTTEINKYFRKNMMTKNKFYDTIETQLGIKEEKGRSRQRGIYKFYCMIAYGLTSDGDRSRGLDDILADLRALPNVTIVTVAIRNQKVAEGRYIAGLAIKFIPSTPGDMNTPENVKARIVRDIKRLENVHSLFKLSTGLIRLE